MKFAGIAVAASAVLQCVTALVARETIEEAAVHARDLLENRSDGLGVFASTFPSDYADRELAGIAVSGMEYFAPVEGNGDLYMLVFPDSKHIHNAVTGSFKNASMHIYDEDSNRRFGRIGGTNRNRMSLFGYLEELESEKDIKRAEKAYLKVHKDAELYIPPHAPHRCYWAIFRVERVYWFGGFGDTHYIGYLPLDLYKATPKAGKGTSRLFVQAGLA